MSVIGSTLEERVVKFVCAFQTLSPQEKSQYAGEVKCLQECIESALKTNFHFALGWGINLGNACNDPNWVQSLVLKASEIAKTFDENTIVDLQPIFDQYLNVNLQQ